MTKYEVKAVVCDYGIYENGKLKLIVNSQANALLIKYVLEQDLKHKVVIKDLLVSETKSKRKLKAINNAEFCDSQPVCFKCPEYAAAGRICNLDYQHDNRPYQTRKGKYILREVKE